MIVTDIVEVTHSAGRGKGGRRYAYIRPAFECANKSLRVSGCTQQQLVAFIKKAVEKKYMPMHSYEIQGKIFGSNSPENALKEWWRVCDKNDIGKTVETKLIP